MSKLLWVVLPLLLAGAVGAFYDDELAALGRIA
jgi:hypothetical protein